MDHQRYVKKKIILGKYEVSAIIGRGTYGTVKRGLNLETGEEVTSIIITCPCLLNKF
jgi:hypothetical protein